MPWHSAPGFTIMSHPWSENTKSNVHCGHTRIYICVCVIYFGFMSHTNVEHRAKTLGNQI